MSSELIDRREALLRVSALLGGIALVGGSGLLTACSDRDRQTAQQQGVAGDPGFTPQQIALLDEIADTILPDTPKSPGAKAARVGAFMALMVTDTYAPEEAQVFRDGLARIDALSRESNGATFVAATPAQRLALVERLDREQLSYMEQREAARRRPTAAPSKDSTNEAQAKAEANLPDARKEGAPNAQAGAGGATAITADAPTHWFRMMKELAMFGYFTSEIGYTKAMRYIESPGRFDPCAPYKPGDRSWAPHA